MRDTIPQHGPSPGCVFARIREIGPGLELDDLTGRGVVRPCDLDALPPLQRPYRFQPFRLGTFRHVVHSRLPPIGSHIGYQSVQNAEQGTNIGTGCQRRFDPDRLEPNLPRGGTLPRTAGRQDHLTSGTVGVRDSKNPTGPALIFTPTEWDAFTTGIQNGEFHSPA